MQYSFRTIQFIFALIFTVHCFIDSEYAFGQVTVGFQGGEPGDTWTFSSSGATALSLSEANQAPNKVSGTKSLVVGGNTGGGNCFGSGSGNGTAIAQTFTFDPLDISASNQFSRTLSFSWGNRFPMCTGTGWDSNEDLIFQAFHDGVPQAQVTVVSGNNNAAFSIQSHSFNWTVPACVNAFYFEIHVVTNREDELLFLDNVSLTAPSLNSPLAAPSAISGNTIVCQGTTENYTITAVSGLSYTWSGLPAGASFTTPNGTPSSNAITVNWGSAPAGTYTLTVTPSDACGNNGPPQTITIQITASTPITISGPSTMCTGETIVLTASASNGISWSTGETTQSISITAPGTYTVSGPTNCGTQTASHTITLSSGPEITEVISEDVTCFGDVDGSLTVISPVDNLEYSINGTTWQTSNVFAPLGPGTYTVTVQTSSGCSSNSTGQINEPAEVLAFASNSGPFCVGDPIQLLGATSVSGPASYQWSGPNGYSSTQQNPVDAQVAGTYTLQLTVNSCVGTGSTDVVINESPVAAFSSTTPCSNVAMEFNSENSSAPVSETITSWNWNFGNGSFSNEVNPFSTYTNAGTFAVTLEITASNGCSASISQDVQVLQSPVANFQSSPGIVSVTDPEVQFTNTTAFGDAYLWIFNDTGSSSTEFEPTYTYPQEEHSYEVTLVAYNAAGCTDTVRKTVVVGEGMIFYVPNSFTPNGDAYNSVFLPVMTSGFDAANYQFTVYNRWGELVFESSDAMEGWDGTFNGVSIQDGTYTWNIRFKHVKDDGMEQLQGNIVLLK